MWGNLTWTSKWDFLKSTSKQRKTLMHLFHYIELWSVTIFIQARKECKKHFPNCKILQFLNLIKSNVKFQSLKSRHYLAFNLNFKVLWIWPPSFSENYSGGNEWTTLRHRVHHLCTWFTVLSVSINLRVFSVNADERKSAMCWQDHKIPKVCHPKNRISWT